jgi:hypothetical protein
LEEKRKTLFFLTGREIGKRERERERERVGEDIIVKMVTWRKWRCEWFGIPCRM